MKVQALELLTFLNENNLDYGMVGDDTNFFWFVWNEYNLFAIFKNGVTNVVTYYDDEVEAALLQELSLALG